MKLIRPPELSPCSCRPEYKCGDNCFNRLVYTECNVKTCPSKGKCKNMNIQRHLVAQVEPFMTQKKGWGVKAKQLIKKGSYILEYVGEVVSIHEYEQRMRTDYKDDIHYYCLHLNGQLVIDSHKAGNDSRYINHSCQPNCEVQKWAVNGIYRMALYAKADIECDEELTYDYNFAPFNIHEKQVCMCESTQCRGVIGEKTQRAQLITVNANDFTF